MNFKSALLIFILALSGCSDFLKGKKSTDHVITVEENEACLKKFPTVFDKYLESKIDGDEIDEALSCLNSTLTRFQSKFRGQKDKDVFSIDDITIIFNFFFKDLKMSRDTSEKLVRFKFALIGGDSDNLSKVDVENLKEFLKDLSVELKNISKWVAVFRSDNGNLSESSIKSAYGQLRMSLINLINSGHISKTQYSVEDFLLLLKQFNFNLKPYSEQIDQLLIVKKFLIGNDYVKSKESYIAAIELILDIMQLNAMIENHLFKFDLKKPDTQQPLHDLMTAALKIIKTSPRMKAEKVLHLETLKELVKFDSPFLTFENLLMIKVIIVGGNKDLLTLDEVNLFEKRSKDIVAGAYKAVALLDIKTIEQFLVASPELQTTLRMLFETTHFEIFLAKSDVSQKIFEIIQGLLKTQTEGIASKINLQDAFALIADAGTFSSKEHILEFLKQLTKLLSAVQEQAANVNAKTYSVQLQIAQVFVTQLQELIRLKNHSILNVEALLKDFNVSEENRIEVKDGFKIFYPQMVLSALSSEDLQRLQNLLQVAQIEIGHLSKWPETMADFENFKMSLKPILAATDFYSGLNKTHDLIKLLTQSMPKELGESKGIKDFLSVLVADREIRNFEEITSVMNSLFGAYQLSKKLSSSKQLGLDSIQDFVSILMVSDAMRVGKKQLDINQLIKILESIPQAKSAIPQINMGMNYLKILFPKLRSGVADEQMMKKMLAFIFILSQQKNKLAKWPVSNEEILTYKQAIEQLLAATDFYSGNSKSQELLLMLMKAVIQNSETFRRLIGNHQSMMIGVVQLLIADRELNSFTEINSVLDTVFNGLDFYKELTNLNHDLSLPLIKHLLYFLSQSDHMQVHKFIRFDLAVQLVNQLDPSILKNLAMSEDAVMNLKVSLIGGVAKEFSLTEVEGLNQLVTLFETKNNFTLKQANTQKILHFFTQPDSVKKFAQLFNPDAQNEKQSMAGMAAQIFKLTTQVIKVKSEFDLAVESHDFLTVLPMANRLIDEFLKVPLFQKSGTLDFQVLQKILKESLDIDISISPLLLDLKKYLLGGQPHQINRADLLSLQKIILFVQKNQSDVARALQVILLDRNPTYSMEEISNAASVIKNVGLQFVQLTQVAKAGMTLPVFIKTVQPLLVQLSVDLDLSLIEAGQRLLVGSYFDYSVEHFRLLINTYVDVLQVVRFAKMGFVKLEIKERNQFLITMHALDGLFKVFENSIAFSMGRKFETKSFDAILAHLLKKGIIPYQVSPELLSSFYKRMLNMVFSQPRINSDQLDDITAQQFIGLKNELILFKFFIHVIDGAFTEVQYSRQNIATKNTDLKLSIERQILKYSQEYKGAFAHDPEFFKRALFVYKNEIMQVKPIVFANGYVISHNQIDLYSGWADQMRAHYVRTLARLLLQGWGVKGGTEINSKGLVKWYADFKDFSIAIKNFDPRSGNSGERSMLEANLFTYSGNGDKILNFTEATQYISLLMSGGSSQFNQIYELARKSNCLTNQPDPIGNSYVKEACAVSIYTENYEQVFSNMNWFVKYIKNLKDNSERYSFFHSVMEVARNSQNKTTDLESLDLRTMNMILLYMESVFSVLDVNQNYTLSPDEIRFGYARFDSLVYSVAVKKSESLLNAFAEDTLKGICRKFESAEKNKKYLAREAFIYLIYNGSLPEQKDIFAWKMEKDAPLVKGTWNAVKNSVAQAASGIAEGVETAWNCGRNGEIFKFEGEVDRKMMINTFKLLKSVLASE